VNIGHYEDAFAKIDGTWLLARRVTALPFGRETERLLPAGPSSGLGSPSPRRMSMRRGRGHERAPGKRGRGQTAENNPAGRTRPARHEAGEELHA
jgi:hypothetical protein